MKLPTQLRWPLRRGSRHARFSGRRRSRFLGAESLEDRRLLAALANGDFESGNLAPWTTFLTEMGTIGTPAVVAFDTDGDGEPSPAAKFQVGRVAGSGHAAGGGIRQTFTAEGAVQISVDIASQGGLQDNGAGGEFSLIVDGAVVDTHNFGPITAGAFAREVLSASITLAPGEHELRIQMTRRYASTEETPWQFVDNVVVQSPNAPPDALDDSYAVDEDNSLVVNAADGVLANDVDPDGDALMVAGVVSGPAHGTLALYGDGSLEYVPDADFHGQDSFVYEVSDGNGGTDQATVNVTVHSVVDAVVDVRPGSEKNPINLRARGVLPVAVLSTQVARGEADDLDATAVDLSTITLGGVAVDSFRARFKDVDRDGDLDLLLHFRIPELVEEGVLDKHAVDLVFAAEFDGGDALGADVSGSDSVRIIPSPGKERLWWLLDRLEHLRDRHEHLFKKFKQAARKWHGPDARGWAALECREAPARAARPGHGRWWR